MPSVKTLKDGSECVAASGLPDKASDAIVPATSQPAPSHASRDSASLTAAVMPHQENRGFPSGSEVLDGCFDPCAAQATADNDGKQDSSRGRLPSVKILKDGFKCDAARALSDEAPDRIVSAMPHAAPSHASRDGASLTVDALHQEGQRLTPGSEVLDIATVAKLREDSKQLELYKASNGARHAPGDPGASQKPTDDTAPEGAEMKQKIDTAEAKPKEKSIAETKKETKSEEAKPETHETKEKPNKEENESAKTKSTSEKPSSPAKDDAPSKGKGKGKPPPHPSSKGGLAGEDVPAKGGGKAGAPPPPPKGKGKGKGQGQKGAPQPRFGGRRLHWRELQGGGELQNSIFDQSLEGVFGGETSHWQEFEASFVQRAPKATSQKRAGSVPKESNEICVLDQRQATNAGIVMCKVRELPKLCSCLEALEPVCEEDLDRMQELIDGLNEEQLERLKGLARSPPAPPKTLRKLERGLLPLVQLQRVSQRVKLLRIGGGTAGQLHKLTATTSVLIRAKMGVVDSTALKDFMRAAMSIRDYVMRGPDSLSEPGHGVKAMDIGSLLSGMREFKATSSNGETLLKFFARSMLRTTPEFDEDLKRDLLPSLNDAAQITWAGLKTDFSQLRAESAFVAKELQNHSKEYGLEGSEVYARFEAMVNSAAKRVADAEQAIASGEEALEELCRYFGVRGGQRNEGEVKEPHGLVLLCQLSDLITGFRQACAEVRPTLPAAEGKRGSSVSRRSASPAPHVASHQSSPSVA